MGLPDCRKCRKEAVLADAGIMKPIHYYYCRNCKIEVDRWGYAVRPKPADGLDELNEYLAEEMDKIGSYEDWDPTWDPSNFGDILSDDAINKIYEKLKKVLY
jgi:hypothetical protein